MTKIKNIIWGTVLVVLGVIIALNTLEFTSIDIFFDGWWTLLIIIPCFIGLFEKGNKSGDIVGIIIGICLLLACRNIIEFGLVFKLLIPAVLIILGISIIFKGAMNNAINKKINELRSKAKDGNNSPNSYCAIFSGQDVNFSNESLTGASFTAVFGGIECDLRGAIIEHDLLIDASAVFGGIDIYIPTNVKVKVKSNSIFGGVSNKTLFTGDDTAPTIYVNATGVFGGVDLK